MLTLFLSLFPSRPPSSSPPSSLSLSAAPMLLHLLKQNSILNSAFTPGSEFLLLVRNTCVWFGRFCTLVNEAPSSPASSGEADVPHRCRENPVPLRGRVAPGYQPGATPRACSLLPRGGPSRDTFSSSLRRFVLPGLSFYIPVFSSENITCRCGWFPQFNSKWSLCGFMDN